MKIEEVFKRVNEANEIIEIAGVEDIQVEITINGLYIGKFKSYQDFLESIKGVFCDDLINEIINTDASIREFVRGIVLKSKDEKNVSLLKNTTFEIDLY